MKIISENLRCICVHQRPIFIGIAKPPLIETQTIDAALPGGKTASW